MALNHHPLVSVVIPSYNRARFLRRAIESVLAQDYPAKEVVVVDDGSTDETEKEIAPWAREQGVVWVRHENNRGAAAARNTGVHASHGAYLVFLDSDDYLLPGRLAPHIAVLERHPELAWVYSDYWREENGERKTPPSSLKGFYPEDDIFEDLFLVTQGFQLPIMTVTLRRRLHAEVGGFDGSFHSAGGEDIDFWLKVARRYPVKYIPRVDSVWVKHEGNTSVGLALNSAWLRVLTRHAQDRNLTPEQRRRFQSKVDWLHDRIERGFHDLAYRRLREGQLQEARAFLKRSISHEPYNLKNYVYWIFTYLPSSAYAMARRLKRIVWT